MDGENMTTLEKNVRELTMVSVFEVFEKMYFIFLESSDNNPADEKRRLIQIRFSGDLQGEMQAYYSETLARTMIENALGLDPGEVTEQIMEDCLKESLNMICGNFLQRYEQEKVLQLSIPEYMGSVSAPRSHDSRDGAWIAFEGDGMALDVIVRFD